MWLYSVKAHTYIYIYTYQRYNRHRSQTSYRVTVSPQKWPCSKHITLHWALRTERLSVCAALRDLMLACTLPAVTPPLVNTGLEVSSVDKNTLASQQRGKEKARSLLFPSLLRLLCTRSWRLPHSSQVWLFFWGGGLQICCEKFKCGKVETVVTKHTLKKVDVCIMFKISQLVC